jgi:ABC-2 type transport system permease protein
MYLISGFRWSFYGHAEIDVGVSVSAIFGFLLVCLLTVRWIFETGWKLKS